MSPSLRPTGRRTVSILDLDHLGRGMARLEDGSLVRVLGADRGERLEIELVAGRRGLLFGQPLTLLEASPDRSDPGCDQAARCPGCQLRHLRYPAQLDRKRALLARTLLRLGGQDPALIAAPVAHPSPEAHRNRATTACLVHGQRLVAGMRALPGTGPDPVDLTRCPAQHPQVNQLLARGSAALTRLGWPVYDPLTGQGLLRHLRAQACRDGAGRLVLALSRPAAHAVPGGPARLGEELCRALLAEGPLPTVLLDLLPLRGQASSSSQPLLLHGEPRIHFTVGAHDYSAREGAWTPISPGAAHLLVATVQRLLDGFDAGLAPATPGERLLELGCGVGTLTLPLAARFPGGTVGVDASRVAIGDGEENRLRAGLTDLTFRLGWAHHAVRRLAAGGQRFGTALLHSIRLPYGPAVLDLLPALGVRRIVYVSPSPASLARDLAQLTGQRWRLEQVVPVDQIPATAHIMGVAALVLP